MPRAKLPSIKEMGAFVAKCWRDAGYRLDDAHALDHEDYRVLAQADVPLDQAVKTHWYAWSLVTSLTDRGEPLSPSAVDAIVRGASGDRAGALEQARVVFVVPLGRYYRLPTRVNKTGLQAAVDVGLVEGGAKAPARSAGALTDEYHLMVATHPARALARALMGPQTWDLETLTYHRSGVTIELRGVSEEEKRELVEQLDARSADLIQLLLVEQLEGDAPRRPDALKVMAADVAASYGLLPHPKGGMRTEDLRRVGRQIRFLDALHISVTVDANNQPAVDFGVPVATRVKSVVGASKVLHVYNSVELVSTSGEKIPREWTVGLGTWMQLFPREYAPLFRNLVQLPSNSAKSVWTKKIGLTLALRWNVVTGMHRSLRVTVRDLLDEAGLLGEAEQLRKRGEAKEAMQRLTQTLDALRDHQVHGNWIWEEASHERILATQRTHKHWKAWLEAEIVLDAPAAVLTGLRANVSALPDANSDG
ncbi:hypothetical protein [Deinococcus pimensis]|uniref:hypothetical protein n=1 Tax=Deinococcus pimensis TaxID=309888 RepID=UPI0004BC916F|nr:hypothetical protein [Deinococcus pimensis]